MIGEDGLGGTTSNPRIFEEAIGWGNSYDNDIRQLAAESKDVGKSFEEPALTDIRGATGMFAGVGVLPFDRGHAVAACLLQRHSRLPTASGSGRPALPEYHIRHTS